MYSNWLVDVRGKELDKEEMIKLPINVTVRGGDDWRDCLRESYECLNGLQKEAERLKANADRYIRPDLPGSGRTDRERSARADSSMPRPCANTCSRWACMSRKSRLRLRKE